MQNRYNWLRKITSITSPVDNVSVSLYDILNIKWKSFRFINGYKTHTITRPEMEKPWLIAFTEYGSADYEDLIYLINGIENPLDLVIGQTLKIPVLGDVKSFINSIKQ